MEHNTGWIDKTHLEELVPAEYYTECCVFLENFIAQRPKLAGTEVREVLTSLTNVLITEPAERKFDALTTIQGLVSPFFFDAQSPPDSAASLVAALLIFGMAGKSLYFLSKQSHSSQFENEITRLFESVSNVRSNIWLFHISALLAQSRFQINFIPETKGVTLGRTPDFVATRGDVKVFVEANARNPLQRDIQGIKDALWNVMRGDDKSGGKQLKFLEPQFDPGLIVVDISNCDVSSNATGLPPVMKLRADAFIVRNEQGRVYDISCDPEFFRHPENQGNIVGFAVRFFHEMVATHRYHVRALLVGISMGVKTPEKGVLGAPKGSLMVVDSRYPKLALQELARQIYLVDTQSPLPPGLP